MTDDDNGGAGRSYGRKFLTKDRWRGKKPGNDSNEPANDFQLNADVVDFLKPSTGKGRSLSPKAPRIDIAAAQRWSGNSPELRSGNAIFSPSSLKGKGNTQRRALRQNLVVKFVLTAPEIIGEGGDEAQAPTIEISRFRMAKIAQSRPGLENSDPRAIAPDADEPGMHPGFGYDMRTSNEKTIYPSSPRPPVSSQISPHALPHEDTDFVPKPLMRTGTSWSDNSDEKPGPTNQEEDSDPEPDVLSSGPFGLSRMESKLAYHLPEIKSVIENSPIEFASQPNFLEARPRDRNSVSAQLQHLMREGEGKALHDAARNPVLETIDDTSRHSSSTTSSYKLSSPVEPTAPVFSSATTSRLVAPQPQTSAQSSGSSSRIITPKGPSPSTHPSADSTPAPQPRQALPLRKPVVTRTDSKDFVQPPQNLGFPLARSSQQQLPQASQEFVSPPTQRFEPSSSLPPLVIPKGRESDGHPAPQTASTIPTATSTASAGFMQAAYEDFVERCSHMPGIFRLQAEFESPINGSTPNEWLRCAIWWFIKGRAGMEAIIRNRPRSSDGRPTSRDHQQLLMQPHVDLAKACWILDDVFPNHPGLGPPNDSSFTARAAAAREANDITTADLLESADMVLSSAKALISSMARNEALPPSHALIQGQDQTVWVKYPKIAPAVVSIFSGNVGRSITENGPGRQFNPLYLMALTDTKIDFTYSRTFGNATLASQDPKVERITLPVLVSTMRPRNEWSPKVTICTQRELVSVYISGDRDGGSSWEDVRWSEEHCIIHVKMPHGYYLDVQLTGPDFKQVWNTYNHSNKVQASLMTQKDERLVFEVALRECLYKDSKYPMMFPPDRVKRCRVRLWARSQAIVEGTGQRDLYRGHRLLVVTSPKNKMLGTVSHELGVRRPMFIEMGVDPINDGAAAMKVILNDEERQCSMYMVFNEPKDQQALYRTLNDMDVGADEMQYANIRLSSLSIEPATALLTPPPDPSPLLSMKWQAVSVINHAPSDSTRDTTPTILSSSLRSVAQAADGTLTDRINAGPGSLLLRLAASGAPSITLLRGPQPDLTLAVDPSRSRVPGAALAATLAAVRAAPSARTYAFAAAPELHAFVRAVSAFAVAFDGVAASVAVARRRPAGVLSLHRRLDAGAARVAVVRCDRSRVCQVLAFFEEGAGPAEALGFVVRAVDVFERVEGKGKGRFGVRLVDAKFCLPPPVEKGEDEEARVRRRFVCLDLPESPREDDDVTIAFEDEQGECCLKHVLHCCWRMSANGSRRSRKFPRCFTSAAAAVKRFVHSATGMKN